MLRVSRLTDYGIVLLGYLARRPPDEAANTRDLAERSGLPVATVCKVLKILTRGGLLVSQRGAAGGYLLARPAHAITMAEVYSALEGPIVVTQGSVTRESHGCCIGDNWQIINDAVRLALQGISLSDMTLRLTATFTTTDIDEEP